ncbi:Protein of unknown function, partial [Gryllus bimaculatus]
RPRQRRLPHHGVAPPRA